MKSSDRLLWVVLAMSCTRARAPEPAILGGAGALPDAAPELVIDDSVGTDDTALPSITDATVSTEAVPPLAVPDGFSSSFGEVPALEEAHAGGSDGPQAGRTSRISSARRASTLFAQVSDDCPPDAVAEQAEIGALTGAQLACAEITIGQSATPAALKNELSLALIANARALQDPSWAGLVERHLADIDPTNPSLSLRLARIRHDEGRAAEALRLAEVALTHRADWPPSTYASRTLVAHQLRTSAAQSVWRDLLEQQAGRPVLEEARGLVVTAAEDWLTYERSIGRKGTVPLQVCRSAGGDCR